MRIAIANAVIGNDGCDNCHALGTLVIMNACVGRELILCPPCVEELERALSRWREGKLPEIAAVGQ